MVRRILLLAFASLATLGVAAGAYVRLSPMSAAEWHRDPDTAERSGKPNDWLVAPGGDRPRFASTEAPEALLARFDAIALAEPRTGRLVGSTGDGFVTYIQRSRLMGYPDAISVRAVADGTGSLLSIWSRSRYGQSDMGVNRKRVERWLSELDRG